MLTKIDVTGIVREHAATLVDERTSRRSPEDWLLFGFVPIAGAGALSWAGARLTPDGVNVLITALSVFAGLLFNLLVLAFSLRAASGTKGPRERRFIRYINVNLEYAILVSLIAIGVLLTTVFAPGVVVYTGSGGQKQISGWVSGAAFALVFHFLLTLLMVLKRMHSLFAIQDGSGTVPPAVMADTGESTVLIQTETPRVAAEHPISGPLHPNPGLA